MGGHHGFRINDGKACHLRRFALGAINPVRGQTEGDDIDLDAWIRYQADQGPRSSTPPVFQRRVRTERSLATVLLADLSLSTDAHVNDTTRVIEVIRDALYVFGEALHACGDEFASWRYFHYARSWKNLYNPQTGWLQSRNADGSWKPLGEDWRESTYKNYFWMVPYDLAGLIETMGGKAAAEKRLDEFFVRLDAGYNDPWFASGNEPSFHIPWVYNWLGRPDKTSKVINRILNEQYTSAPDGLPGNDDLGTMGAWYVFACTGLYPMIPGVGGFTLSTPVFDKVVIHLKHGDITITDSVDGDTTLVFETLSDIPIGHKIALQDLTEGDTVIKYGTDIGKVVQPIKRGEHLHVHNVKTKRW